MKKGLCAIGEALIDFIPQEKGCRLKDVVYFQRVAGGAPANVAGACAKLGGLSRMITQLGKDAFGDYIIESLEKAGIDTGYILRTVDADTALAFVSLAADGNRDFQFYRRNSADLMLSPKQISKEMLKDCGISHFCSVSLVESAMKHAHEKLIRYAHEEKLLVCFDPNLRFSLWNDKDALYQSVHEFMPYADILKISDDELSFITGKTSIEESLEDLLKDQTRLVIYTKGKEGVCAYTNTCKVEVFGLDVECTDTTGAGDSFIGAFLYCLLRDEIQTLDVLTESQLYKYLNFANAYAAYTITQAGALDAMADAETFAKFRTEMKLSSDFDVK